jgi:ribonucleoside-triphosphate reductase
MQYMTDVINSFIERDNVACGIESSPAENAGIKLARHDVKFAKSIGKKIFTQGYREDIFLTSGCMTPFSEDNFNLQIENAAEFQSYFTSGTILHHFIEDKIPPKQLAMYISKLLDKPINYITLSPTMSACMECGQQLIGQDAITIDKCPICKSNDIATFSRVIGYTKMIARRGIKVDKSGLYKGKYNFWSKARRYDWAERKRLKEQDLNID